MGVCTSNSCDRNQVICAVQASLGLGKKQRELVEVMESERGKVHSRVTELYESALVNPLSITVINFNLLRLGASGSDHIAKLVTICPNVSALRLWKCQLGEKGIQSLSKALPSLQQLQVLNLDDNELGTAGAKHLANCLPYLANLRELHCRSNALECEGIRVMAEMMGYLANLTLLTIDDNDITSFGLEHLLSNVPLEKLEKLGLSYNRITDCGGYSLIKCAERLQNLHTLQFKGNLVSALVAEKMMRAFQDVVIE